MIINEIENDNGKIFVVIDCDCDGLTASALLLNFLHASFPNCMQKISYMQHENKYHGIEIDKIPSETTLVIVPDASSSEYEIHKELSERGIKVCILDHHTAPKVSEYACVVNNQLCDYPTKSLSGVGVVYKLCQYINPTLADNFLDLVAIGLIGDVMDIRDFETHYLIQKGLSQIRNPFIKGMIEKNSYSLGEDLSPIGIAFYVIPLINAVVRVGTMEEKNLLFDTLLDWKAYDIVPSTKRGAEEGEVETKLEQCLRICSNIKRRQTKEQDEAAEQIQEIIEEQNLLAHKVLVIQITEPNYDKNITGLIANRLMAEYQRPVCLITLTDEKNWTGSVRCPDVKGLENFKDMCEKSGYTTFAAGHQHAFGIGFSIEKVEPFVQYMDMVLQDLTFSTSYKVDFIFNQTDNISEAIFEIDKYKSLWGSSPMDEPLIAVENIAVTKDMVSLMSRDKNPTLKIQLSNGVACIRFKSSEEELLDLCSESGCVTINLIARAGVNRYFNSVTPQLLIVAYEIINRQKYYF